MPFALLALVLVGVWLFCLLDILTTDEEAMHGLPKFGWLLVALLGFLAGAAAWLLLGRPRRHLVDPQEVLLPPPDRRGVPTPKGPDDDPAFLRDLDRRLKGDEDK
ncbi:MULTISPECIES: PLDc N-terminal domain-containing protein [Thermomonosporaceae]|uniref:PLDc N-terminal domain-containing protein n=1 Tax=Thermomonosporaceae TaxID=2012 RepID=UPI00255AD955|nr:MULTISPECIES: PLDc N-terminal domain-containing protein [Thermomonosporaceae]MDL4777669.1 PLDc N-terminal domain-containing protein [Actinomadura xylanilytica]